MLWLDAYERRARLAPGLLALLPVAIAVTVLGLREAPIVSSCVGLISVTGGPLLLATYVRVAGLRAQDRLWDQWGGPPTRLALQTRTSSQNPVRRDLWRDAVSAATRVRLLTAEAELTDPTAADNTIDAAIARLRGMTRGKEYGMVLAENMNYGFQRNLYALRHVGRVLAVAVLALLGTIVGVGIKESGLAAVTPGMVVGLLAATGLLLFWILGPSSAQVRRAGDKYAEQLLDAALGLGSSHRAAASNADSPEER